MSYLPFLSGINFGLECVCIVFLFSALSCIPLLLIPSHSSDPRPKDRLVFHIFSKSITMETHGSLLSHSFEVNFTSFAPLSLSFVFVSVVLF